MAKEHDKPNHPLLRALDYHTALETITAEHRDLYRRSWWELAAAVVAAFIAGLCFG